jgi:hypothetical protein
MQPSLCKPKQPRRAKKILPPLSVFLKIDLSFPDMSCIGYSRAVCSIVLLLVPACFAQRGALTASRSLDELAVKAETIVQGTVIAARVEPHPQYANLMTVVVKLAVSDTLKGTPRKTLEFRQFIWDIRDRFDAAGYRKGEELLLLLNPVAAASGLTSPVGLGQGRFHISRDASGRLSAANETANAGLFRATEQRAAASGMKLSPRALATIRATDATLLPLDNLKELLRVLGKTGGK